MIGLGRVGGALARLLAEAGAELTVADVDSGKRALADELGARWTDPERRCAPTSTSSRPARWAACSTRSRSASCAAA